MEVIILAKTAKLNIRIEPETKAAAEQLFSALGITITDAVTIFLKQALLTGGIPFPLELPKPNKYTLAAMEETESIINSKEANESKSVDDFFQELNEDEDR